MAAGVGLELSGEDFLALMNIQLVFPRFVDVLSGTWDFWVHSSILVMIPTFAVEIWETLDWPANFLNLTFYYLCSLPLSSRRRQRRQ